MSESSDAPVEMVGYKHSGIPACLIVSGGEDLCVHFSLLSATEQRHECLVYQQHERYKACKAFTGNWCPFSSNTNQHIVIPDSINRYKIRTHKN